MSSPIDDLIIGDPEAEMPEYLFRYFLKENYELREILKQVDAKKLEYGFRI